MNKEQRRKASIDLTLTYLLSYYADWRLAKVLTIEKLLSERHDFYKDIVLDVKNHGDNNGAATIAQEIRHGLYFDAIAHCVQYVEDLFALIKAAKQPDYFVRHIITYKAGEVTNSIKNFKISTKSISEIYHFPQELKFTETKDQSAFDEGAKNLTRLTEEIITFYKGYEFFYNQYKHGLSVAMRPFGNLYTDEQIAKDKGGDNTPYLVVYDSLNLEAASSKGTFNVSHGVLMPGFTENVRPFIGDLSKENNFLRFVFPPDIPHFSMHLLVDHAKKTRACVQAFIANYTREISFIAGKREFQLPSDYKNNKSYFVHICRANNMLRNATKHPLI
jgi:hypothetical protein